MEARSLNTLRHVARGRALSDLAEQHRREYQILYTARLKEVIGEERRGERSGSAMGPRLKHKQDADNHGLCVECGESYPCRAALRRKGNRE